jgi:AcrR family transcriptional regulator
MVGMTAATGRREASKQATRLALRQAATRLFAEQGYQATTVRQIVRAAHVGERTFYRYFDGKEDLLAEQALAWVEMLCESIRQRPAREPPYAAVTRAMVAVARQAAADADPAVLGIITDQQQPLALLRRAAPRPLRRLEDAIAGAVQDRLGTEPGPADSSPDAPGQQFQAQLLARVAVAALRTAAIRHRQLQARGSTRSPGIEHLLRDAFTALTNLTSARTSGEAVPAEPAPIPIPPENG